MSIVKTWWDLLSLKFNDFQIGGSNPFKLFDMGLLGAIFALYKQAVLSRI